MASGRHHDRATWVLGLPFALLWWPWLGPRGAISGVLGFLSGSLVVVAFLGFSSCCGVLISSATSRGAGKVTTSNFSTHAASWSE